MWWAWLLAWPSLAAVVGVIIGQAIRTADRRELCRTGPTTPRATPTTPRAVRTFAERSLANVGLSAVPPYGRR
jgi:hypothetical protein